MVSQLINTKVLSTLAFSYTVISIGKNKSNKLKIFISRGIDVLPKVRNFVDMKTLVQLYHAIIVSFSSYGCVVLGNTYDHNIKPLQIIQRKAIRLITFSNFDAHTSPLFAKLNLLKLQDNLKLQTLFFMQQFNTGKLPKIFDSFFVKTSCKDSVIICSTSRFTFYLPKIWTNYGKFNIWFNGPKLWNELDERIKYRTSNQFKKELRISLVSIILYCYSHIWYLFILFCLVLYIYFCTNLRYLCVPMYLLCLFPDSHIFNYHNYGHPTSLAF